MRQIDEFAFYVFFLFHMFIVAGTNQVSARLPLQPSIIKIYVQSLASECLRERGPLYIHSSSSRG